MAKNLKFKIKNTQLAKAINLGKVKLKPKEKPEAKPKAEKPAEAEPQPVKRRVRAKFRSAFAPEEQIEKEPTPSSPPVVEEKPKVESVGEKPPVEEPKVEEKAPEKPAPQKIGVIRKPTEPKKPATTKPTSATASPGSAPPKGGKKKVKEFRDIKSRKMDRTRPFDSRDRQGLRSGEDGVWRRRRRQATRSRAEEIPPVRPSALTIRVPISLKDLAGAMKLKSSELISKLFAQGMIVTLNDALDDETTIQLLGHEFGCEITVDTSEEERIRVTGQTVAEEIAQSSAESLEARPPVIAFMGHVDHGKTSLIDRIRDSNRVSGEAGAITQHIGAFQCETRSGKLSILDTPGHEAFTAMRARGAEVTDVVVLVVAGDEGIRAQTEEATQHAKAAGVAIVVAINKSDKPGFNAENVYRQLADLELLPEAWGGTTITVNCSAVSGDGVDDLLEMLALQTEVLELKADPSRRARGSVLESEMHTGLGSVATVLVQNGSLRRGEVVVIGDHWGRVKTMRDEFNQELEIAPPATPIAITGLSGTPQAGDEFVVVKDEKEARHISEARYEGTRATSLQRRKVLSIENLLQEATGPEKKVLYLILRADVQGSLEALKTSLEKIESDKAEVDIIFSGIGAISESDVELAIASNAAIIGFHTTVESHADSMIKQGKVQVYTHDVIYQAIDKVRELLTGRLEQLAEEKETGMAEVLQTFKSSHLGTIAGCSIKEGTIHRNHKARLMRDGEQVWEGNIASIRRDKDDVREIKEGFECGIVLEGFNDIEEGDQIQAYEIIYVSQEL